MRQTLVSHLMGTSLNLLLLLICVNAKQYFHNSGKKHKLEDELNNLHKLRHTFRLNSSMIIILTKTIIACAELQEISLLPCLLLSSNPMGWIAKVHSFLFFSLNEYFL